MRKRNICKIVSALVCCTMTISLVPAIAAENHDDFIAERLTTQAAGAITKNLTLPKTIGSSQVTYVSDKPDVIYVDAENERGVVKQQSDEQVVKLTASIGETAVKEFQFTVPSKEKHVYESDNLYSYGIGENPTKVSTPSPLTSCIVQTPGNLSDKALKITTATTSTGYPSSTYTFSEQATGNVVFKTKLMFDGDYSGYNKENSKWRKINFFSTASSAACASIMFFPATNSNVIQLTNNAASTWVTPFSNVTTTGILPYDTTNKNITWFDLEVIFDFTAGTYTVNIINGVNVSTATSNLCTGKFDKNCGLKAFTVQYRDAVEKDTNTYLDDITVLGDAKEEAETTTHPIKVQYGASNQIFVRTPFNETQDIQNNLSWNKTGDVNDILDFASTYLIDKNDLSWNFTNSANKLASGGDEKAPFNINGSYIGATHGQNSGVRVSSTDHGKTYADIGSLWKDNDNTQWTLLKIEDANTLLFLSQDLNNNLENYKFKASINGNKLTYVSHGVNEGDIAIDSQTSGIQVLKSCTEPVRKMYKYVDGTKSEVSVSAENFYCDFLEIEESYNIINPATIGDALRQNQPEGGYTQNQNLAVGTPMMEVKLTYQFYDDGTIITVMNHKALQNLEKVHYGGVQFTPRNDLYGGGVFRYIPKTKEFSAYPYVTAVGSSMVEFDFASSPIKYTGATSVPANVNIDSQKWENADNPPDRVIDYYKDASGNIKAFFVAGYLPIDDGRAEVRKDTCDTSAIFVSTNKKGYPWFIHSERFEAGDEIKGVAYKKFVSATENTDFSSNYSIPYENSKYYYTDYHKTGDDLVILSENYDVSTLECSENINISYDDNVVFVESEMLESPSHGYGVFKAEQATDIIIKNGVYSNESLETTFGVINVDSTPKTIDLIVAAYDGNQLLKVVKQTNVTLEANVSKSFSIDLMQNGADKVKIMIWDGKTLVPKCKLFRAKIINE